MSSKNLYSRLFIPVLSITFALALILGTWTSPGLAELENCGLNNEYFHDTVSGLYWFDPGVFYGGYRETLDHLNTHSTTWNWATSTQIDGLVGQSATTGFSLEDIMGPRLTTIGNGGPRWVAFYAEAEPDGWLVQSDDSPDFATMTFSGFQGGAAALDPGAWMVSSTDPTIATAVIENAGNSGEFFHDLDTDLYWSDPATFYGQTRAQVDTWIGEHIGWRWATANEIYALLGKTSHDGAALEEIMGDRLTTVGTGGPRWVGFYDQESEPNGILIQAGISPHFYLLDTGGTQGGAHNLGAGAWVVSESDPTPVDARTLDEVKALYR